MNRQTNDNEGMRTEADPGESRGRPNAITAYQRWMREQDIPIHGGYGVYDVREAERKHWDMTGTDAAFIDLIGMEGFSGIQIIEIPPGGTTRPMKHMYQELICVIQGTGSTQVWTDSTEDSKHSFEWETFSLFSPPLNCWFRLFNGSNEPAILMLVNDAPMIMDLFHNNDFIFNNPYQFVDRFDSGDSDFFQREERYMERGGMVWETNFINNAAEALVDAQERKGPSVKITIFDLVSNSFAGHLAEWETGMYHKAHHHQGGAILLIMRAEGYSIMWPQEVGVRPYQNGFADEVVRVDWGPYSVFSPPTKWFHAHMNTGTVTARQLAFRPGGSSKNPTGFRRSGWRVVNGIPGVYVSYREGGTLIEYEDEDPQIRKDFEEELKKKGIPSEMPDFKYNDDVRF